jgi:hypothetical protein
MQTQTHSEAIVAVPSEVLWDFVVKRLDEWQSELYKRQKESKATRRINANVELLDRYRQEVRVNIAVRLLTRSIISLQVNIDPVDAVTTCFLGNVEIKFRGFRGWLLKRVYIFAMRYYAKSTLQELTDKAIQDWAKLVERTYQRFGNLAEESISETEKDIQKEQST